MLCCENSPMMETVITLLLLYYSAWSSEIPPSSKEQNVAHT